MAAYNSDTFPDQLIDPRKKGKDYILQYTKAAYGNSSRVLSGSFYFGNTRMEEIRQYAMGKQSVNKYKKILTGTENDDNSWMSVDWSVISIIPKLREIAISTMMQKIYDTSISAVDELSKTEQDKYINQLKIKIAMREALQQAQSPLLQNTSLQVKANEPQDMEQLEIETQFGFKHILATELENVLQIVLQENKSDYEKKKSLEDLYDYGLAGYTTYIDENGKVIYKNIPTEKLVLPYCEEPDFSDAEYIGYVDTVSVSDLVPYFDEDELKVIINSVAGKYDNPYLGSFVGNYSLHYDKFRVQVLSLRFNDYDIKVYKKEIDSDDNERFGKTEFEDIGKVGKDIEGKPKFLQQTSKVVRKCRWIIDTDFIYEYGVMENMNRKKSSWHETDLGIYLMAWNFNKMQFTGITERMIPIADAYMLTWYKLQNITNQLIPYIINIDYDALEQVPFGKSGENLKPMEIMDLIFQKYVAVGRSSGLDGNNKSGKIVSIEHSGMLEAFGQLYNDLSQKYNLLLQVSGFNAATDGSTINAKTLNGATVAMQQSTNSALFMIVDAEKKLFFNLCDGLIQKIQIATSLGKADGYIRALGKDTIKMISLSNEIPYREFGLYLEEAPSQEEWQEFLVDINKYDQQGLLEPQDKILLRSYKNLKKAYMILSYIIKKRKEEIQQIALQNQQSTAQVQIQSAQAAEQAKQKTLQVEYQLKMQIENAIGRWQYETAALKVEGGKTEAQISAQAKIIQQQIIESNKGKMNDADINLAHKKMQHEKELHYADSPA